MQKTNEEVPATDGNEIPQFRVRHKADDDGGLRALFRKHIPQFAWTSIESALTVDGIPDAYYCASGGIDGWLECKATSAWAVHIRASQIGWISRHVRYGGRAFIAVRRRPISKRESGVDELWLLPGKFVSSVSYGGLKAVIGSVWEGGPRNWDWKTIAETLKN